MVQDHSRCLPKDDNVAGGALQATSPETAHACAVPQ